MTPIRSLFRLLLLLAGLALVPVVLVVGLLAALQSEAVRTQATTLLTRLVPGVEIEGLGPGLPFRLDLARLVLDDADGPWLTLEGLTVRVAPEALLSGRVELPEATIDRLHLRRLPAAAPATEMDAAPPTETAPFRLPDAVPPFALERLEVRRLEIDQPVVGAPLVATVAGRAASPDGARVMAELTVQRIDVPGLDASLEAELDLAERRLALDLAAADRSGFVDRLAGPTPIGDVRVRLAGQGPLAAWPARLEAAASEVATADLDLVLGIEGEPRLEVSCEVASRPALLDGPLADLLGGGAQLDIGVVPLEDGLAVERLAVETDWLSLGGTAALQGGRVRADLDGRIDDLAPLRPLVDER
ncbi:MAG: hypothetical protein ACOCYE_05315, partial [Pseudomonadota bacterium]